MGKFTVKVIGKIYSLFLFVVSLFRGHYSLDPTRILIARYTSAQNQASVDLRHGGAPGASPSGHILVIIPFRDRWDLTYECLKSLNSSVLAPRIGLRVILADNRSVLAETQRGLSEAIDIFPNLQIEIFKADYDFNFSRINNDVVKEFARLNTVGLLFLNNDVLLADKSIVYTMYEYLECSPKLGVVGCTLLYPNHKVQHLFVAPGVKIIAAHPVKGHLAADTWEWFKEPIRPVAAVTGAMLMMRPSDFNAVGGFDEDLPTIAQDVDLCLKTSLQLNKFSATVRSFGTFHIESPTKSAKFPANEIEVFNKRWLNHPEMTKYYSQSFSRWSERPLIKLMREPPYPSKVFGNTR
jgi:GT2 family glycosyltransferase